MNILVLTLLIWLGSALAGFLGALTGLGGGVVLVPLLTLAFGIDIHYAMGASLVSVIATSSGAASAFVREGYSNIRIGMFLEIATTLGALLGAFLTTKIPTAGIGTIFGLMLLYSAYVSGRRQPDGTPQSQADPLGVSLKMNSSYPTSEGSSSYGVRHVPAGFAMMFGAGTLSGLLGVGSGPMKVVAMDQIMKIPFKVSTTTSNFMIGVTAATSAGIYFKRGYIDPGLAMPVMLGVLVGSLLGARVLFRARTRILRWVFSAVIVALGIQMILHSLKGGG
ncbi:MAG: sulfite exporter TauE/SafE family protein [Acidobacteriia bacterium]|nr:sulfite exporter TauE/SafE family protein [Terriglobia bacterium]